MAKKPHPNSHRPTAQPVNSSFLRCFGFHRKITSSDHRINHERPRKIKTWFRSRMINKSPVRTVPLDHSADLTIIHSAKTPNSKIQEIRVATNQSSKFETCKKRLSFCRKADAIQPGSGNPPPLVGVIKPNAAARHETTSTTTTTTTTQETRAPARIQVGLKEKHDHAAALGMSIVIVTLVIMLIWGRFCAILCTSAWFYFCPRLRTLINHNDDEIIRKVPSTSAGLDLNSVEHKKRVVFEGFLDRTNNQHR